MNRSWPWLVLLCCCLTLGVPRACWSQETPVPKLIEQLDSMDPADRQQAAEQLSLAGARARVAVPALLSSLAKDPAASVRAAAASALGRLGEELGPDGAACVGPLTAALSDKELSVRLAAAGALESYTSIAAVQASSNARLDLFLQAASDPDATTRETALDGLLQMKSDRAIPLLVKLAGTKETNERALAILLRMSERAKRACIGVAIAQLGNTDEDMRDHAVVALANAGSLARVALPRLTDMAAHDSSANVRLEAAFAISLLDSEAAALPYLVKAAGETDQKLADTALSLLSRGGADMSQAVPVLVAALSNPHLCSSALSALGGLGPAAAPAVPAVVKVLQTSTDSDTRALALRVLSNLGSAGATAVLAQRPLLADPDANLRIQMAEIWWHVTQSAADVLPAVTALLKDKDERVRTQALSVLIELRDSGRVLEPVVLAGMRDKTLGPEGLDALMAMQLPNADVVPVAAQALADADVSVRMRGLSMLTTYSSSVLPEVVPLLRKAMSDSDSTVQVTALEAYWRATNDVAGTLPVVQALLATDDNSMASSVFSVCRQMKASARPALGAMLRACARIDRGSRIYCVEAIQEVGGAPDVVVPLAVGVLTLPESRDVAFNLLDKYAPGEIAAALATTDPTPLCEYLGVLLRHVSETPDEASNRQHRVLLLCDTVSLLGSRARAAAPALTVAAQHDNDAVVQQAAREALAKTGK